MDNERSSLCFISNGRVVNVPFAVITRISKQGSETHIYTEESILYRTKQSLLQLLRELPGREFFRIHRSHIISLKHLKGWQCNKVKAGVDWLPMSYYYKKRMLQSLTKELDERIEFQFQHKA
jgi:two-component system LytT family response regulator